MRKVNRRGRWVAALMVAALGMLPAACTGYELLPLVALAEIDGGLAAVAYVCSRDAVASLRLDDRDKHHRWAVAPADGDGHDRLEDDQVLSYPIFDTPDDWEVKDQTLERLEPKHRYRLSIPTQENKPYLDFTTEDLDDLVGDDLLVATVRGAAVVRRDQFERNAEVACRDAERRRQEMHKSKKWQEDEDEGWEKYGPEAG